MARRPDFALRSSRRILLAGITTFALATSGCGDSKDERQLSVEVVDGQTGRPLAGLHVRFDSADETQAEDTTNADGRAATFGRPDALHVFEIADDGTRWGQSFFGVRGGHIKVVRHFQPTSTIDLVVRVLTASNTGDRHVALVPVFDELAVAGTIHDHTGTLTHGVNALVLSKVGASSSLRGLIVAVREDGRLVELGFSEIDAEAAVTIETRAIVRRPCFRGTLKRDAVATLAVHHAGGRASIPIDVDSINGQIWAPTFARRVLPDTVHATIELTGYDDNDGLDLVRWVVVGDPNRMPLQDASARLPVASGHLDREGLRLDPPWSGHEVVTFHGRGVGWTAAVVDERPILRPPFTIDRQDRGWVARSIFDREGPVASPVDLRTIQNEDFQVSGWTSSAVQ